MAVATITVCDVLYEIQFERAEPSLTLTPIFSSGSGSAEPIIGRFECCGCNYAIFAFGGLPLCTDSRDEVNKGCGNIFRLKIELDCCPITDWEGPGWYCVVESGGDCADAVALELLDENKCDDSITICSGPYTTQEDAETACSPASPVTTLCCPDNPTPQFLSVTFGGGLAALGTVLFHYVPPIPPDTIDSWATELGGPSGCGVTGTISLACLGSQWQLTAPGPDTVFNVTASPTCDPFSVSFSGTATGTCPGAFTVTVSA